jgi:microcystin synthetase protein McyA
VRFHIHRRTDSTFEFWLSECHPLFDGWSLHSTLAEVFNNYFALINGEPLPEAQPPSIAASDYVYLERLAMTSEKARDFWAEKLSGFKRIEIPKRAESSSQIEGSRIGLIYTPIPDQVAVGLRQLAAATAVPFKSVLLAAYMKVLSIISGQSDVLAGLVINGRPEGPDGDRVLGLFFNVVPFRLDLSQDTWGDLVRATFDAEQEMFAYRRYPLAAIQNSLGGHPLFDTLFNYLHFYVVRDTLLSGNLEILEGSRRWEETNFKLSIGFSSDIVTSRLTLVIRYDRTELAEQQVRDIINYFENVLRAMTEDADQSHEARCHLTPDERHRLAVEWNDSRREFLPCDSIHELFEAQVKRSPEAVALVYEGDQLTYRELNGRANQIAHHLMSIGVGPDSRVGILMSRSAQSVISMLGVIKAGGAYVPLGSEHPLERLTFMIRMQVCRRCWASND